MARPVRTLRPAEPREVHPCGSIPPPKLTDRSIYPASLGYRWKRPHGRPAGADFLCVIESPPYRRPPVAAAPSRRPCPRQEGAEGRLSALVSPPPVRCREPAPLPRTG